MRSLGKLALGAGVAALATAAVAQPAAQQQRVTGPIAVYWMSARTQSGFGMPSGGGRPDPQAMMRAMMGGGGAQKSLTLQLGSSQAAQAPAADHLPPAGLQAGAALPLVTPRAAPQAPPDDTPRPPPDFQRPRGRMLIFWGCGERARPGQPVVIDFAQMAQNPALAANAFRGLDVTPQRGPAPGRNTTYGDWPNERTTTSVPPTGSLIGDHTVRGNYSPEIKFALNAQQDFLGGLNLVTNEKGRGGFVNLGWELVPGAQAYVATVIGGGSQETVVMWSSAETQVAAFALPEFIAPGDLSRLVANRTLMGPTQAACAVPKEVVDATGEGGLVQLVAYGGEANFVHPPRPADPKVAWNQQWAVKVRYRSATGGLLGQAMPQIPGGFPGAAPPGRPPPGQQPPGQPPRGRPGIPGLPGGLPIPIPGRPRLPF